MKAKGWLIIMAFLSLILVFFNECKKRAGDIGWSANIEMLSPSMENSTLNSKKIWQLGTLTKKIIFFTKWET